MKIEKYFWDLNEKALKETKRILRNPGHPKFLARMTALLSRCGHPKEIFTIFPKKLFIKFWPSVRSYWLRLEKKSEFRDWWQTVYEQILRKGQNKETKPKGGPSAMFLEIGRMLRNERIKNNLSQKELAIKTGMKQPDISLIEEGKKNITLGTLARIARSMGIERININI